MDDLLAEAGTPAQGVLPFDDFVARATEKFVAQAKTPRKRTRSKETVDYNGVDLNLPLFDLASFVADATYEVRPPLRESDPPAALSQARMALSESVAQTGDHMTVETLAHWHAALLYRQLELLLWSKDAESTARSEILDWIFVSHYDHKRADGTVKRIDALNFPFSFELCCVVEEVNAEVLRETIRNRINQIKHGSGERLRACLH